MQRPHARRSLLCFALITLCSLTTAYADHDNGGHRDPGGSHIGTPGRFAGPGRADRPGSPDRRRVTPAFHDSRWALDSRFHHDHFYPRVGYTLSILPPGYLDIGFHNRRFFFDAGVWFRQEGTRYVVVTPPAGVVIPVLPPAFTTVWIGDAPYYYANGIYYTSTDNGYVTVAAPQGYENASVTPPPPAPEQAVQVQPTSPANDLLFIYPKKNQSEAQITSDRVECARWGTDKTGYDPIRTGADDPRRGDYLRAVSACLEGRGYSVK
jgi:hypothetical protein